MGSVYRSSLSSRMNLLTLCILVGVLGSVRGRDIEDARIIAAYSTKTAIVLTTSTTTTPFTCAFATNGVVCQRRRYKRFSLIDDLKIDDRNMPLSGSVEEVVTPSDREPRIALTVWTTSSSTFTVTLTSTNTATTFSLSFYCTVSAANFPPACG